MKNTIFRVFCLISFLNIYRFKTFGWFINIWEDLLQCHMVPFYIVSKKELDQSGKMMLFWKDVNSRSKHKRRIHQNCGKIYCWQISVSNFQTATQSLVAFWNWNQHLIRLQFGLQTIKHLKPLPELSKTSLRFLLFQRRILSSWTFKSKRIDLR